MISQLKQSSRSRRVLRLMLVVLGVLIVTGHHLLNAYYVLIPVLAELP